MWQLKTTKRIISPLLWVRKPAVAWPVVPAQGLPEVPEVTVGMPTREAVSRGWAAGGSVQALTWLLAGSEDGPELIRAVAGRPQHLR